MLSRAVLTLPEAALMRSLPFWKAARNCSTCSSVLKRAQRLSSLSSSSADTGQQAAQELLRTAAALDMAPTRCSRPDTVHSTQAVQTRAALCRESTGHRLYTVHTTL